MNYMKKHILFIFLGLLLVSNSAHACSISSVSSLQAGSRSSRVSEVQNCLIENGYNIGGIPTGYYGSKTTQAIKSFYKDTLKMDWDGRSIGPKGLAALKNSTSTGNTNTASNYRYAKDADDLKKYLNEQTAFGGFALAGTVTTTLAPMASETAKLATTQADTASNRVSQTNVQVAGIDEPDIIKTDGKNIFMAKPTYWYGWGNPMPMVRTTDEPMLDAKMAIMPPYNPEKPKTQIIDVDPIADMNIASERIDTSGEMLYEKDSKTLVVFGGQVIAGYDVSDNKNPTKKWTLSLKDNTNITTSRLKDDTLYIITSTWLDSGNPCPIIPILDTKGASVSIPCNQILVPQMPTQVSQLYTVMKVAASTGNIEDTTSIAESGYNNAVAMFENNLYIATNFDAGYNTVYMQIYLDVAKKFVSSSAYEKIQKINSYDISQWGKRSEIEQVVSQDLQKLGNDERMKAYNNMQNDIQNELGKRARELYQTKIARVSLSSLDVAATGTVPGQLVNQFALDEYNGHLRVATTVGENWGGKSANDVYVLGMDLKEKGSIKDLGLTERIYSVRFMGDTGYLVTFRQTDPFYVLDLKDSTNPKVAGELKIPGYSSYLHELETNKVLGIGREAGDMKLSLFDVTDPKNPVEIDKYLLKNNWSEAENNHRAFLQDADNKVFFIPGTDGAYIFSYEGNKITLKKTVSGNDVKRAIYIGDNMYIIAQNKITVIDENTWTMVKEWEIK